MDARRRLLELLLLVRDDCFFDGGWYVLRPYSVERLLEAAIEAAKGLVEEQRQGEVLAELTRETEALGLYE